MRLIVAVLAVCVAVVKGQCVYSENPGLFPNGFENVGDNSLVMSDRTKDTSTAYGGTAGTADIRFATANAFQIMQADESYTYLRVCDNGVMTFGESGYKNCPTNAEIANPGQAHDFSFLAADAILQSASGVEFLSESYGLMRSAQFDASGNKYGPSLCDLDKIAAIITDCDDTHRQNITVQQAVVVTWKISGTGFASDYLFQAILAVADYDGTKKTRIVFLYKDYVNVAGRNNIIKGQIHARNAGLTGTEVRYSKICSAESDTTIHLKSNCRCAQAGHYVFDTMETTTAPHGFCGTGTNKKTCANQASLVDDGSTINRNCRAARKPLDTCHATVSCLQDTTNSAIVLQFKNVAADRYVFLNYTAFTPGGFADPHGGNIQPLLITVCGGAITPTNATYMQVTGLGFNPPTTPLCFTYDSTANVAHYVIAFYDSTDGFNVTSYKSKIYVGQCHFNDLPQYFQGTHAIGQVKKTTLPARTGRSLWMTFWDRRGRTDRQIFTSGTTVELGRPIYIAICINPGTPFEMNADDYGVYGYDCWASNNAGFATDGNNRVMQLVMASGCRMGTRLAESFKAPTGTPTFGNEFCVVSGAFSAFRWKIGGKKLYVRCKANFCRNTQLYDYSKCKDSCANTIINSNATDPDDARKRRDVNSGGGDLFLTINVADKAEMAANSKECADPVIAKGVIGALVALLIISTVMAVLLFCVLQKKTK